MKPNKYDKYVFLICIVVFFYSFFIVGQESLTRQDMIDKYLEKDEVPPQGLTMGDPDEVVSVQYPTSIFITPPLAMLYLFFMLFEKELMPVNRHFFVRHYYMFKKSLRQKIREGLQEQKEWLEQRKKD